MKIRLLILLTALATLVLICGCTWGEEGAVRSLIHDFIAAVKEGKIEQGLELLAPEHPSAKLLNSLKMEDEAKFKRTLTDLGGEMRSRLEGATIHIRSVRIEQDRAKVIAIVLSKSTEEDIGISAVKRNGEWLISDWRP